VQLPGYTSMTNQPEFNEVAVLLIQRYGRPDAAAQAIRRARLLELEGELEAASIWRRVADRIAQIMSEE